MHLHVLGTLLGPGGTEVKNTVTASIELTSFFSMKVESFSRIQIQTVLSCSEDNSSL